MIANDTTLLIKLPSELKGAYQGLCKSRGLSVSAELRRFMANELKEVATAEATERPTQPPKDESFAVPARCADTIDMFNPETALDADRSAKVKKIRDRYRKGKKKR